MAKKIGDYVDTRLYNLHPDIKRAVDKAIAEEWTPQRFENELKNSSWWKARAEAQRQWETLVASDPKTASRQEVALESKLRDIAQGMGFQLSSSEWNYLSNQMLRYGLTEDEAQNWIAAKYQYGESAVEYGTAAEVETALREYEWQYGVSVTNSARQDFIRKVLAGEAEPAQFQEQMIAYAKSQYPTIADALDQGVTTRQYFSPYIQTAVNELGINEADVDLNDTMWKAAVQQPGEGGTMTPMRLDDWQRKIRTESQYGWQHTKAATDQSAQTVAGLMEIFGKKGA